VITGNEQRAASLISMCLRKVRNDVAAFGYTFGISGSLIIISLSLSLSAVPGCVARRKTKHTLAASSLFRSQMRNYYLFWGDVLSVVGRDFRTEHTLFSRAAATFSELKRFFSIAENEQRNSLCVCD
jgi:hypothetical protein